MTTPAGSQQSQSLGLVRKISIFFFDYLQTIIRNVTGRICFSKLEAIIEYGRLHVIFC